jgi:hypothetical protein
VGAVIGHGFHPLKAPQPRSIPNLQSAHPVHSATRQNLVAIGALQT